MRAAEIIKSVVGGRLGVSVEEIDSRSRITRIATARMIAMDATRKLTGDVLEDVGRAFSRDHGTVIHAVRVVKDRCETDERFSKLVSELRAACAEAIARAQPEPQLQHVYVTSLQDPFIP